MKMDEEEHFKAYERHSLLFLFNVKIISRRFPIIWQGLFGGATAEVEPERCDNDFEYTYVGLSTEQEKRGKRMF